MSTSRIQSVPVEYVALARQQLASGGGQQFKSNLPGGRVPVKFAPADTPAADALAYEYAHYLRVGAESRSRLMRADGLLFLEIEEQAT